MTTLNEKRTETGRHCAYCGLSVNDDTPPIERFDERFCSEAHAGEFASGVRAARMLAAAQSGPTPASCAMPAAGQRRPRRRRS